MSQWKPIEGFCPKCGKESLHKQDDTLTWPRFSCSSCNRLFNIEVFKADTVRIIDEA